ncbi:MAG: hypothetical protein E7031_04335 [Akkermansiaceae bacterium]|nr:hypothetical protein [Akkermansiaceae bacterium]
MKKHILNICLAISALGVLNSCLVYQGVQAFVREEYPGSRPAMVIKDVNGKPASQNWLQSPSDLLPPSSFLDTKNISKASDGTPYGLTTKYKDIIISPHFPHHQLDYTGFGPGDKVWDPYTRKPFYIKRAYTFN